MKTQTQHSKKAFMWYKVTELQSNGLNMSQISIKLGIYRSTVRKYLSMDEQGYLAWISVSQHRPKKLNEYRDYVKRTLESHPYLSASQVEDWLKEHYPDLPCVHSKTVYNFVEQIRKEFAIHKTAISIPRQYEKLPETAYGDQAQADFGSFHMPSEKGNRCKVYFFVMILSRSRQKFVHFQTKPFTSQTTIEAHNHAFEYFEGQPDKILYDQDRVLMVEENLGDLVLTKEFQKYSSEMTFTHVFCRKADPESKGKVENVVGFVKKNFLRGRTYTNEKALNELAREWLTRTGNGKMHAGIQKIPYQEWLVERAYLHPYYKQEAVASLLPYKVRKDNTISYKSNFYTLPLNTYQGASTTVYLEVKNDKLHLYASDKILLTTHDLCTDRGQTIRNRDHQRDKSQSLEFLTNQVGELFFNVASYPLFIELLSAQKKRYLRDNLLLLKNKSAGIAPSYLEQAVKFCIEGSMFNANTLIQAAIHYQKENEAITSTIMPQVEMKGSLPANASDEPQTSNINTYQAIM